MTIQEFQNQITELINEGKLSPDMEIVTFDGNVYHEIKNYSLDVEKIHKDGKTVPAIVINTEF